MPRKRYRDFRETIAIEISYGIGRQQPETGAFEGGVEDPPYLDELQFNISAEQTWDEETDEVVATGGYQLNLYGTKRAYRSLATFLLGCCAYADLPDMLDPDYHAHFDEMTDSTGADKVHLIIHGPKDELTTFEPGYTVGFFNGEIEIDEEDEQREDA